MENLNIEDIIDIDLYEVLNVSKDINNSDLKKQYKKMILLYHPDKNDDENNNEIFELITLSYNILINKELRQMYNNLRDTRNEWDFIKLKKQTKELIPNNENKNFNLINEELNNKHGYKPDNKILNIDEFNIQLNNLINERNKELIKYKKLTEKEFIKQFDKIEREEINQTNELIPYNDLYLLNGINHISKLYDTNESLLNKQFILNRIEEFKQDNINLDLKIKKYYDLDMMK